MTEPMKTASERLDELLGPGDGGDAQFPHDIMQSAQAIVRRYRSASLKKLDLNEMIARAILAERERCAKVADARADAYAEIANKHEGTPIGESNTMRCGAAAAIADAIRGQS